ncbi:MAG: hypothetical protein ACRD2W_05640 [Acidimicrobiales bacterium]
MSVPATSVSFADAARRLADACRAEGLVAPGFRSPPARPGVDRTLRRRPDGGVIVAVRVRGRPLADVLGDLVDGVIAANGLSGDPADSVRRDLLAVVEIVEPARAA